MRVVKVVAVYDDDERQNIIFIGRQNSDGTLDFDSEYFGYVTDWNQESNNYLRYSFTMEQMNGPEAIIEWGGFDLETKTALNIFERRIVPGEKIIRKESNEQWEYTVKAVTSLV